MSYQSHGLCIYIDQNDNIVNAFLYSEGYEEFSQYKLDLPHGIKFSDTREDVYNKLGEPEIHREKFARYDFGRYLVHFQYSSSGSIDMVTIMDPLFKNYGEE